MSVIAGIGGLVGGINGLMGGGGQSNPQRVDLGPAISNLQSEIPNLGGFNLGGANLGQFSNLVQQGSHNPFSNMMLQGGQGFSGLGIEQMLQSISNANTLAGGVSPLMNAAFDPQNALYARTAQQSKDASLAALSGSGLATTPYGQGVFAEGQNNFNIDWQNNLLQRMIAGSGAASGLANNAFSLGGGAASQGAQFASLPYQLFQGMTGDQMAALERGSQYGQGAAAIPQMQIADWLGYMGQGNQANNVAINQQAQNFKENQIFGSEIGNSLSMLSRGFPNFGFGSQGWGGGGGGGGYYYA